MLRDKEAMHKRAQEGPFNEISQMLQVIKRLVSLIAGVDNLVDIAEQWRTQSKACRGKKGLTRRTACADPPPHPQFSRQSSGTSIDCNHDCLCEVVDKFAPGGMYNKSQPSTTITWLPSTSAPASRLNCPRPSS